VLLAITNNGKVGLGFLAGLLIAFAILSAFYFPRRNPDFPGNRLGLFILVSIVLFAGTMVGVVVFAAEEEEHGAEATETHGTETGEAPPASTEEEAPPASTEEATPASTEEEAPPTSTEEATTEPSASAGDAAAGEAVFASAGCGGCHTLEAAGSSGNVGPNLDEAKPAHALVVDRVTNGKSVMPSFKGQLSEKQIQDVAAYVVASTHG
jgi:mono/diheme cytochrome c family protein